MKHVVTDILVDSVFTAQDRKRKSDSEKVKSLANSILDIGLINPISIRPNHQLIAGLHRVEAYKLLGMLTIPAIVIDYEAANDSEKAELLAEIAEIDENLKRHNLTALQEGVQHARRKVIYETLHPETAVPGRGKNQYVPTANLTVGILTYVTDASAATGNSESTVRRQTRIGNALGDVADLLEGTAIEDNQSELLALASVMSKDSDLANEIIARLVSESKNDDDLIEDEAEDNSLDCDEDLDGEPLPEPVSLGGGGRKTKPPKINKPKKKSTKKKSSKKMTVKNISKEIATQKKKEIAAEIEANNPTPVVNNQVSVGDWWQLGRHKLYCGDTSKPEFYEALPHVDFAFADPPYGVDADEWDSEFYWDHDWLIGKAPIVAVTPGIISIFELAKITAMPYRWSMAAWITNGMARGEVGFGNWIYISLFAENETKIFRQAQDVIRCTIDVSKTEESTHRGRKPAEMIHELVGLYCPVGKTVIDPFLGSGTTLLVAEEMNRSCIGGELSPDYCWKIIGRWESVTGEKAVKL